MRREPFPVTLVAWINTLIGWTLLPLITVMIYFLGLAVLLFSRHREGSLHGLAKMWGWLILKSVRGRVHLHGREHLEEWLRQRSAVIACNHVSILDIPILLSCLPGQFAFLAKIEVFSIPLLGPFIRRAGYIPIKRGDRHDADAAMDHAVQALHSGWSPLMFPEGTRSPDGDLGRFKRGTLLLAARTGRPILPIAIRGVQDIMPRGSFLCRPGDIHIRIGPLCTVSEALDPGDEEAVRHACDELRSTLQGLLDETDRRTLRLRVRPRPRPERMPRPPVLVPLTLSDRSSTARL